MLAVVVVFGDWSVLTRSALFRTALLPLLLASLLPPPLYHLQFILARFFLLFVAVVDFFPLGCIVFTLGSSRIEILYAYVYPPLIR